MIPGNAGNAGAHGEAPTKETQGVGRSEKAPELMGQGQDPRDRTEDGLGQILGQISAFCEKQWEVIVGQHAEK